MRRFFSFFIDSRHSGLRGNVSKVRDAWVRDKIKRCGCRRLIKKKKNGGRCEVNQCISRSGSVSEVDEMLTGLGGCKRGGEKKASMCRKLTKG